jgi:hypothetical protein
MAQTKSRSGGSKRSTSRSSSTKSRNGSGARSTRSRSSSRATNRKSSTASKKSSTASKKPSAKSKTQSNGSKLTTFAQKAKAPAAAGGAALIGLAGGLAMSRNHKRKGVLGRVPKPNLKMPNISMPKPDSALRAVGDAAGQVADRSQRLGQVAAEVQKASDAISKRS